MAGRLDAKFFRKAKKVNRAVEITDSQAFIPAVKDSPEVRVPLPNRRLKTIEERKAEFDERFAQISTLEEEIEIERKTLLSLVKNNREGGPASEVVAQNLKVLALMERRSALVRPQKWLEEIDGLSLKDVFQSKRDVRKIGAPVYVLKRRLEPITSLYVDLGMAAELAEPDVEAPPLPAVKPKSSAPGAASGAPAPEKPNEDVAKGVMIGQKKTVLKSKKLTSAAPAAPAAPSGLASVLPGFP
jgi:hypothetical protein